MCKRNLIIILCLANLLFCCPTFFQTRASSGQDYQIEGKINAPTAVQLQVVLSGLSAPVYVTHAHDGTNRLFIIEQVGRIRVAQPGESTSAVFLDISTRVLSGGERGLLGLAFHPQYSINGRFFVFYTRQTDGALTVSEFHVMSGNLNAGDPTSEIVLNGSFPIAHSANSNHNGGCIQFGPDHYLYIGTGDGGSANDPPNNGQNIDALLGKILRIDVDTANGAILYSSPPSNPFIGLTPGADEIFAYGMRNPWRFSFDRANGQLLVGDVGQGAREEIDVVTAGGNYGWRIMEGSICNPAFNGGVCTPPSGHLPPIFEYSHTAGRCSITGGYAYRGARSTVPTAAYVYGEYCTGEIWQLQGNNTLLIDTTLNITSFGEDEAGEIYVVGQGGSISRLTTAPPPSPCTYMASPTINLFPAAGTDGTFMLTTANDCGWIVAANVDWITFKTNSGAGTTDISFSTLDNLTGSARSGIIHAGGQTFTVVQDSLAAADCVFNITPSFQSFPATGGSGSFNLFTEERCAWEAVTTDQSWITITSSTAGIGDSVLNFTVGANTTGAGRKGLITIGNKVFSVKQKA